MSGSAANAVQMSPLASWRAPWAILRPVPFTPRCGRRDRRGQLCRHLWFALSATEMVAIIASFAGRGNRPRSGQRQGARWVQCLNQVVAGSRWFCGDWCCPRSPAPRGSQRWLDWLLVGRLDVRWHWAARQFLCLPHWVPCEWACPVPVLPKPPCVLRFPRRRSNGRARRAYSAASSCMTGRCGPCGCFWVSGWFTWPTGWRYYLSGNCAVSKLLQTCLVLIDRLLSCTSKLPWLHLLHRHRANTSPTI